MTEKKERLSSPGPTERADRFVEQRRARLGLKGVGLIVTGSLAIVTAAMIADKNPEIAIAWVTAGFIALSTGAVLTLRSDEK